jgi:SNF2 family DNA or RNA helicase
MNSDVFLPKEPPSLDKSMAMSVMKAAPPTKKRKYFVDTPTHATMTKRSKRVDGSPAKKSIKVIDILSGSRFETLEDWVKTTLRDDQMHASNWLIKTSQTENCAVLAADMGFGKTLTCLYTMVKLWLEASRRKPSLVLVSKAVMTVWQEQIDKHLAPGAKQCISFIAPQTLKGVETIDPFSTAIVVATYESIQSKKRGHLLRNIQWSRIVLDEGHCVRNINTKRAELCLLYKSPSPRD